MTLKPGDRTEARCTRCSDITGHVIIAIVNGEIIKVQCCACNSVHKYYPAVVRKAKVAEPAVRRITAGADRKAVMAATPRRAAAATAAPTQQKAAVTRKAMQAAQEAEQNWRAAMERPSAPEARPYAIDMTLAAGDVVSHPVFGMGVVQSVVRPDKAVILFRDDTRNMRCRVE